MTSPTGVIVEVWEVKARPDLDPFLAFSRFSSLRETKFGKAESLPVFLHETGCTLSKQEFNKDLGDLIATFPALDTDRDKWSGHSCRSGISTILSILGLSVKDIRYINI